MKLLGLMGYTFMIAGPAGHIDEDARGEPTPVGFTRMKYGQGWSTIPADETAFFAAVNLPLLDFTSRTGPEAGFETGAASSFRGLLLYEAIAQHFACMHVLAHTAASRVASTRQWEEGERSIIELLLRLQEVCRVLRRWYWADLIVCGA